MKVVADVVLTDSQGCWSLVGEVQSQVKPAVSPALPHLKLQELRDVEQETDYQGGQDVDQDSGQEERRLDFYVSVEQGPSTFNRLLIVYQHNSPLSYRTGTQLDIFQEK